jgi:putative intracellular protease/amidase
MRRPVAAPQLLAATVPLLALLVLAALGGCRPAGPEREAGTEPAATEAGPAPDTSPAPPVQGPVGEEPANQAPETWRHPQQPGDLPTDRPLRAGFLVVDGVYDSELAAPYDVLHHTVFHTAPRPGIEVFTVSPDGRPVTTYEGLRLTPHHSFANAPAIDVLVVPSAKGSMDADLQNAALIDWVRRTGEAARYVMSLCDGAFVLAKAGLLDGKAATTFPDDYGRFAQMFPQVDLRINVSFVHDGKLLTSQGGARSYDVAMHLVDWLYGTKVAQGVGHGLLIPWPPSPASAPHVVEPSGESTEGTEPAAGAAPSLTPVPGAGSLPEPTERH